MSFLVVSGTCRPQTFEALEVYKNLQREANRVLDANNKELIYVDGRIGNKTIDAVNFSLGTDFQNCSELADRASTMLFQLKSFTSSKQLAVVADPESIVRSIANPPSTFDAETGQVVHPSGIAGIPLWAVALVAASGGYYYFYQTPSGKRKRKSLLGA